MTKIDDPNDCLAQKITSMGGDPDELSISYDASGDTITASIEGSTVQMKPCGKM